MTLLVPPPYASAREIYRGELPLLLPPTRETVDEYAALHRRMPRKSGNGYNLWNHEDAPYLAAPMRTYTSHLHLTTAIVGPAQCGKTASAENMFLHAIAKAFRNILWYMQTDESVEAYVKKIINPMIAAHAAELASQLGKNPEDNALHFKRFVKAVVEFLSFTESNLVNKNAPIIIADEWDLYDRSIGDPKALLDRRRQFYGKLSHLIAISHPDLATGLNPDKHWLDGIMKLYADSDRRVWYWPCPQCEAWSSPAPWAKRVMTLNYEPEDSLDEIQKSAHLLCPVNGCIIEGKHRRAMNTAAFHSSHGGWIGLGQDIDEGGTVTGELVFRETAGFAIQGVMNPFLLNDIGGLAREWEKEKRAYRNGGDDKTLKQFVVKALGYPFEATGPIGTVDAETLAERALGETWWARPEDDNRVVPEGVRFLTAWIDVQIAHFELLVRGWGVDAESWVIDKRRIPADTATDKKAWLELLEGLIAKRYPLATDASRGMAIRAIGYDSQGAPGTNDRAYETWTALRAKGLIRNYGKLDGRDLWSVIPTRGMPGQTAARLSVVYPDSQKKGHKITRSGVVPQAQFNANVFKDDLAGQLQHALPQSPADLHAETRAFGGYVHIPAALRSKESPHVNFEQLVSEKRDAVGRWTKPHQGIRNEMLDLMVGNHVLARLHGLMRFNWAAPPAHVGEWSKNSMIAPIAAATLAAKTQKPRSIADLLG